MLDEDSSVLESEKECEQKRMRQINLKGGGPPWGKAESANENQIWAARRFGLVWFGLGVLIWAYTFSGGHSAGPVDTPRAVLG